MYHRVNYKSRKINTTAIGRVSANFGKDFWRLSLVISDKMAATMPDQRKFAVAYARLVSLRGKIPSFLNEQRVRDYHSIVDALQEACGDDLSSFRIPAGEMKRRIVAVHPGSYRGRSGHAKYSDKNYCDREFFERQVDGLHYYIECVRREARPDGPPASTSVVSLTSEREFQRLAG